MSRGGGGPTGNARLSALFALAKTGDKDALRALCVDVGAALQRRRGDLRTAAGDLGISRATLDRWVREVAALVPILNKARGLNP